MALMTIRAMPPKSATCQFAVSVIPHLSHWPDFAVRADGATIVLRGAVWLLKPFGPQNLCVGDAHHTDVWFDHRKRRFK